MTATDAAPPHENLLTCLYTDVESSTEMSKHSAAYKAAMAEHDTRLRGLIAEWEG